MQIVDRLLAHVADVSNQMSGILRWARHTRSQMLAGMVRPCPTVAAVDLVTTDSLMMTVLVKSAV